jgi:hypothetical protein
MNMTARILLVYWAMVLGGCTSPTDRPTARPDDQPRVPVNRNGASSRPEAKVEQPTQAVAS